jgi:hypothetical protein
MIALVIAVGAAAAALPEAAPLGLDLKVAPEEVTLGEHIQVELSVAHDPRDVYSLPSFDPAPLAVPPGTSPPQVRREEVSKDRARTIFTLTLTDYGTLEPRIPDLVLHVTGPDGPRQLSIHGRPLKFRSLVKEENQGAPDTAHHGPKPPVPVLVRSLLWLWLLLGLAALIAALLVLRRLRARRQQAEEAPEAPALADDEALQRLAALRESAPWKRGEGRSAIYTLSEIVRGYLGARLHFNALDLTSEEFLEELHRRRLIGLDLAELTEEVRWEDLVKFAKLEPTAEECLRAVSRSESMVHHTRPLRAIPRKAA